jgi:4-carboxymuconolactone decarboxylase
MGREALMLDPKALYPERYMSVAHLFGDVWARGELSLRDRQLITLTANSPLPRPRGKFSHYRSARHIGITHEEICELMIQVGHDAGWPAVSNSVRQYTAVLEEEKEIKTRKNNKRTLV